MLGLGDREVRRRLPRAANARWRPAGRLLLVVLLYAWALAYAGRADRPLLQAGIALAAVATLLVQPRWPLLTLASALGILLLPDVTGYPGPDDPYLALLVLAAFGTGRHAALRHQPWAAAGVLMYVALVVREDTDADFPAQVVFPLMFMAGPWLLGLAVRQTGERARREADTMRTRHAGELAAEAAAAAQRERLSIARDLHDVVAHSVSAIALQAQVARRRAERGETVGAPELLHIERSAREAMVDLRRMLGLLRPAEAGEAVAGLAPVADLARLPELLEECRTSGQEVRFVEVGTPRRAAPGLSTDAFRIVQEALTNARRHGTGEAVVTVEWGETELHIRMTNPLAPSSTQPTTPPTTPAGHGLIGMRERVAAAGGQLEVGAVGDSWSVDVRLPVPAREPA